MPTEDTRDYFEQRLAAALDHRGVQGNAVRFWWRDDDAVRYGPSVQRLFQATAGAPLSLAVIPESAQTDLAEAVADEPDVTVFQHGWAHVNHAPRGQGLGAWELDGFRPAAQVLEEMREGKSRLEGLFGDRFTPVMVPPWNRVHTALLPGLAATGFVGISAMSTDVSFEPVARMRQIDCRFDVLRWKTGARFAGWRKAADALVAVLMDPQSDPIVGINTHHHVTDRAGWAFIECLNRVVAEHAAAEWVRPDQLFTQR